jgi:hypothetical protein
MELPKRTIPTLPPTKGAASKRVVSSTSLRPPVKTTSQPVAKKTFNISQVADKNTGEKIIIYAATGLGKSTLASTSPNPVFIDLDKGCENLRNPTTNERLNNVPGVESFDDVRAALQQQGLFKDYNTVVIDNATVLQDLAEPWIFENVPGPQGAAVRNIEGYGFNKGYKHLYDAMKLVLQDCDNLTAQGKNIILIAQSNPNRVPNPGGEDFLCEGPRLYAGKPSIESLYCEWANHVLYITYQDIFVKKTDAKKAVGKATGGTTRVVYSQPEIYFRAKTRQLKSGEFLPPAISFEDRTDDSLWQYMFGGKD